MAPFVLTQACHIRRGEFHWSVWSEYSGLSASVRGESTDNSVCAPSPSYNTDAPNEPLEISHSGTHIAGQRVVIMLCWHEICVLKLLNRIFHTLYIAWAHRLPPPNVSRWLLSRPRTYILAHRANLRLRDETEQRSR